MDATGPISPPETVLPGEGDQPRPRRFIRLGIGALLVAVPLAVVALGLAAPVSESNAAGVRVVGDSASSTATRARSLAATSTALATDDPSATSVIQVRRARRRVTTTTIPSTTATSTTSTTTSTSTTAPPATATTAPPVTTTTAAPQPAPRPAPQPASATSAGNSASGQATWYRWKVGNCAHNTLPKGTRVTVTNTASGVSAVCVVGDRGAFGHPTIIDLDASVFSQIAPLGAGRINVSISW